ncbi:MAG: RNA polymerase [Roseiflexaceae bacterium]
MADAYWQALGLAAPARRTLIAHHCHTLADLCQYRRSVVAQWHGIGPNALTTLETALRAAGLAFVGE